MVLPKAYLPRFWRHSESAKDIGQIPLPKVVVLRRLLLGFKQLPFSFIHVLFLFAYWLAVSLALRSDEIFLLDPKYVSMTKDEIYICVA